MLEAEDGNHRIKRKQLSFTQPLGTDTTAVEELASIREPGDELAVGGVVVAVLRRTEIEA